jgi:hypothetical protein
VTNRFEPTDEEKQYWKAAAERRKATALRLGRWAVYIDPHAIVACHEFWTSWCAAFGKEKATDYLVEAMTEEHFRLLARLEYAQNKPKGKWVKTSAKRLK